ncbi:hypothetical protein KIW84_064424 [Lathyrus oleraceus]|uniref:Uncharacterized protein n=1 Tax=Pisum sativum TaxID=3888 RepID=A0A9D4WCI3_PEA|nr:hypothetical protein KIW84_064424 [Pisum sativum]
MLTGMKFSGIQTEVAFRPVFRYPDRSGVQASFPVSRPKWRSGQFSGIQTEVAFRPVFRYPDRSGVQASFPVSRPKWRSGQFSGIQTEVAFRPVFRYPDRSGVQASFPVSRPKWRSGQFSGIQTEVAFRPVFQYPDRSGIQASFPVSRPKWHSGQFSDVQIEVLSSIQTDERHSGHGYFCVTIYFGTTLQQPSGSPEKFIPPHANPKRCFANPALSSNFNRSLIRYASVPITLCLGLNTEYMRDTLRRFIPISRTDWFSLMASAWENLRVAYPLIADARLRIASRLHANLGSTVPPPRTSFLHARSYNANKT